MNIRKCPICSSSQHEIIFSFDYDYVTKVLNLDAKLLDFVGFQDNSFSNIVKCLECNSSYVREDYEIDKNLDEYSKKNPGEFQDADRSNINQGVRKTWQDKLNGKEFVNNTLLNILTTYSIQKLSSPIPKTPIKVLDFGCGWGNWLKQMSNYNFIECYGYDINKFKVESLNQLKIKALDNINDIRLLGLFDVIICNDVIEHVDNPIQIIEELSSLLMPKGILYAAVPRFSNKNMVESALEMKKGKRLKLFHLGHINYLLPITFKKLMFSNGFKPINSQTSTISWVNGPIKSNLIGLIKFFIKIISFPFTSRYTNVWTKY